MLDHEFKSLTSLCEWLKMKRSELIDFSERKDKGDEVIKEKSDKEESKRMKFLSELKAAEKDNRAKLRFLYTMVKKDPNTDPSTIEFLHNEVHNNDLFFPRK